MREPSLGPTTQTVLFLVAVCGVAGTTFVWQFLYGGGRTTAPEAVVGMLPSAIIGVVCGYYAIRG